MWKQIFSHETQIMKKGKSENVSEEITTGIARHDYDPETYYLSRNPDYEINILSIAKLEDLHKPLLDNPPRG